jgi:hypothetical protein
MMESQQQQEQTKPLRREAEEQFAIPGILWQTWYAHELLPLAQFNVDELRRLNPDYSHRLVNDSEAAAFMVAHFGGQHNSPRCASRRCSHLSNPIRVRRSSQTSAALGTFFHTKFSSFDFRRRSFFLSATPKRASFSPRCRTFSYRGRPLSCW